MRTRAAVGWAFRDFNPLYRKDPSCYPLLCRRPDEPHPTREQSTQATVHDPTQAASFLREVIDALRMAFGRRLPLEFRMDAAFFQRDVLRLLAARACVYAIKVGLLALFPLKQRAIEQQR